MSTELIKKAADSDLRLSVCMECTNAFYEDNTIRKQIDEHRQKHPGHGAYQLMLESAWLERINKLPKFEQCPKCNINYARTQRGIKALESHKTSCKTGNNSTSDHYCGRKERKELERKWREYKATQRVRKPIEDLFYMTSSQQKTLE